MPLHERVAHVGIHIHHVSTSVHLTIQQTTHSNLGYLLGLANTHWDPNPELRARLTTSEGSRVNLRIHLMRSRTQ